MYKLTDEARKAVSDLASRYNLSVGAVEHMLVAVNNGAGSMAQFNCPELGGSGQWMRDGMIMVGDMFNNGFKSTVDNLCIELSDLLATTQVFPVVPAGAPGSAQWWPTHLGTPSSTGSQNASRYAVFANRLAVEKNGNIVVYDTLDHIISGVSQQQGPADTLSFSSQVGTLQVSSLPVVEAEGVGASNNTNFAVPATAITSSEHKATHADVDKINHSQPEPVEQPHSESAHTKNHIDQHTDDQTNNQTNNDVISDTDMGVVTVTSTQSSDDIIDLIEKLARLHEAGILDDAEFKSKKQELLARL